MTEQEDDFEFHFHKITQDRYRFLKFARADIVGNRVEITAILQSDGRGVTRDEADEIQKVAAFLLPEEMEVRVTFTRGEFTPNSVRNIVCAAIEKSIFSSFKTSLTGNDIKCVTDGKTQIVEIELYSHFYTYAEKYGFKSEIEKELNRRLFATPKVEIKDKGAEELKPLEIFEPEEAVFMHERKITPTNVKRVWGRAVIASSADYIADFDGDDENILGKPVTLCGKVSGMHEYTAKIKESDKDKNDGDKDGDNKNDDNKDSDKDGGDKDGDSKNNDNKDSDKDGGDKDGGDKEKKGNRFYVFRLDDSTANLPVKIFTKKPDKNPISNIKDGACVIIKGRLGLDNYGKMSTGELQLFGKAIATCDIDFASVNAKTYSDTRKFYRFVHPKTYTETEQLNFFANDEPERIEFLKDKVFVVYDFETTGVDTGTLEIIEIAGAKIVDGKISETFDTLVKPKNPIPSRITSITGISNDLVADAPALQDVFPDFYRFIGKNALVGHNSHTFDDVILRRFAREFDYLIDNESYDTLKLARRYVKGVRNHKLGTLCTHFEIQLTGAHRALNDVIATAKLFKKIIELSGVRERI